MSQYYQLMVGNVHEEEYFGWLRLCGDMHELGLLEGAILCEVRQPYGGEGTTQQLIMEAIKKGDPEPERYIP